LRLGFSATLFFNLGHLMRMKVALELSWRWVVEVQVGARFVAVDEDFPRKVDF